MDALRNAIPPDAVAPRISPLLCAFIAKAVRLSLHPDDAPMYTLVNKFILSRAAIDLDDVPLFYVLFNSSSPTYRLERFWILRLLCWGCQSPSDYRILRRRRVLDLVMHMYVAKAPAICAALCSTVWVVVIGAPSMLTCGDAVRHPQVRLCRR